MSLRTNLSNNNASRKDHTGGPTRTCKPKPSNGVGKLPRLSANNAQPLVNCSNGFERSKQNDDYHDKVKNCKNMNALLQKHGTVDKTNKRKERNNNNTPVEKFGQPENSKETGLRTKENNNSVSDFRRRIGKGDTAKATKEAAKDFLRDVAMCCDQNNCADDVSSNNIDGNENNGTDADLDTVKSLISSLSQSQKKLEGSSSLAFRSNRSSTSQKNLMEPTSQSPLGSSTELDLIPSDPCDLSTFDFDHMTKPETEPLSTNQLEYIKYCRKYKVLPNGHILRNIDSTQLFLRGHSLGTTRIKALCSALLLNSSVSTLEISEDQIDIKAMQYLLEIFQDNSTIHCLFLQDNNMGRRPVKLLLDFLTLSDQLVYLSLSGNRLLDTDGDILGNYVNATQNLNVLDLSYNRLETNTAELLGKALVKNTSISTLSLRWNHMGGDAVTLIVACLIKNRTIESLDLSWNGFNQQAVTMLCKALRVNSALTELDISNCQITGDNFLEMIAAVKKNVALRVLALRGNIFSCQGVTEAFQELVKIKGELVMKEVDMSDITINVAAHLLVQKLMAEKDMMILHGPVMGRKEGDVSDVDMLASLNPVTVLIELGNLMGMSIEELFEFIDEDGSGTLTREEIKTGLYACDIPLPEQSVDLLIRKLDRDGDGDISLAELMAFRPSGNTGRIGGRESKAEVSQRETGDSRCRKILKRMYKSKEERDEMRKWEQQKYEDTAGRTTLQQQDMKASGLPPIGENNKVTG